MRYNVSRYIWLGMAAALLSGTGLVKSIKADHAAAGQSKEVLDLDGETAGRHPDVAWNRTCDVFLAVYDQGRTSTSVDFNIYGRYVTGDGLARGAGPFRITSNDLRQQNPAIAYNPGGRNFLVVWEDHRNLQWEIWGQRVGCNKDLIGDPIRMTPNENVTHYQLRPDVTCGRYGCWVVWEDFRNGNWDIYAQKVTAAGALDGDNIRVTPHSAWQRNPAIAVNPESNGCELNSYMVVWDDSRNAPKGAGTDIYAQQLGDAGVCGENRLVYAGAADQSYPDIAYGTRDDRYQVVWEDARNASTDVYARMIDPYAAVIGSSFVVARQDTSSQSRPHVAYDAGFGNEFTTVWNDQRSGGPDVFEQRTSGMGIRIAGNTAIAATSLSERDAAIAFGDTANHYLIVFVRGTEGIKSRAVWR